MQAWVAGALLALSGLGSLASARAQAEQTIHFGADCFSERDTNHDGRVTLLEARAAALAFFEFLDVDRDGRVTRDEAVAQAPRWRVARSAARFRELDRDRDGFLANWETSFSPRQFAWMDRDADRRLSSWEWWAASERTPNDVEDTTALRSVFWRRDLNRDGRVTRDEVLAAADQRFMREDKDRNGVLTRGESHAPHRR